MCIKIPRTPAPITTDEIVPDVYFPFAGKAIAQDDEDVDQDDEIKLFRAFRQFMRKPQKTVAVQQTAMAVQQKAVARKQTVVAGKQKAVATGTKTSGLSNNDSDNIDDKINNKDEDINSDESDNIDDKIEDEDEDSIYEKIAARKRTDQPSIHDKIASRKRTAPVVADAPPTKRQKSAASRTTGLGIAKKPSPAPEIATARRIWATTTAASKKTPPAATTAAKKGASHKKKKGPASAKKKKNKTPPNVTQDVDVLPEEPTTGTGIPEGSAATVEPPGVDEESPDPEVKHLPGGASEGRKKIRNLESRNDTQDR